MCSVFFGTMETRSVLLQKVEECCRFHLPWASLSLFCYAFWMWFFFFLHRLDDKFWLHSPRCGLVLGTGCLLLSAVGSVKDLACTVWWTTSCTNWDCWNTVMTNCWIFEIMKLVSMIFVHQQIVCFPFFPQLHIGDYSWPLDRPGLSPCWWTAHEQRATWLNELIGEEEKHKRTAHILCSCIAFQRLRDLLPTHYIHVFSSPKVVVVSPGSYFGALERSWQLWTGGSCCLWGSESEGATIFPGMMLT